MSKLRMPYLAPELGRVDGLVGDAVKPEEGLDLRGMCTLW